MSDEHDRSEQIGKLRELLRDDPGSDRFVELADLLIAEDDLTGAIRVCELGIGYHPELAAGHLVYGKAMVLRGRLDEGIQAFERACTLRPSDVDVLAQAGQCLVDHDHGEAARPYLAKALSLDSSDPRVMRLHASIGPPPRVDEERQETRPISTRELESGLRESRHDQDGFQVPTEEVSWPAWDSHPPPPTDAFSPEDQQATLDEDDDEDEPPTVYTQNPLSTGTEQQPEEGSYQVEDPFDDAEAAPDGQADDRIAQDTILDPSAGLRAEVSRAVDQAVAPPAGQEEPPTMFDSDGDRGPSPWADARPVTYQPHDEPPTMFEGAGEQKRVVSSEPPPTQYTTSPDGAIAPFREVVATPAETFSYVKVFLVLVPFLVVGLALGGYVAYQHIRSEKIESLLDQARSSAALDTFHGYGEARQTLGELLELDAESTSGKALLAMVAARTAEEFGPNLALQEQARQLLGELEQVEDQPSIQSRIDLLWARFHLGDTSQAAERLAALVQSDPDQPGLAALAGAVAARQGKGKEAVARLRQSLAKRPSDVRTIYQLALLLEQAGKTKLAVDQLDRALAINGIHVRALLALADLHLARQVALPRVKSDLEKIIELPRVIDLHRAEAYTLLARVDFLLGDRSRAVVDVKAASKLLPGKPDFQLRLARLCRAFCELDEARKLAERVLKARPEDIEAHLLLVSSDLPRGRSDRAIASLEALEGKKVPAAPFLVLRGEALLMEKRYQAALSDLERVPADTEKHARARGLSVLAYLAMDDADQAHRTASSLLSDHPADPLAHYAMGRVRQAKRMRRSAATSFLKAVKLDPAFYPAMDALAWAAFERKRYERAREWIEKALAANPYNPHTHLLAGKLKLAEGDTEGALGAFARMVKEQPAAREGYKGMAEALMLLSRNDKALLAIEKALKAGGDDDARIHHLEGKIHLAMGHFFPAVRSLVRADRLDEKNPEILADLGLAQLGARSISRAQRSLEASLKRRKLPRAQEGLAKVLKARGKHDEAARAFEKAAHLASRHNWDQNAVARMFMDGGREWVRDRKTRNALARARRLFRKAARLLPDDPEPLYELAAAYDRDDKLQAARRTYLQVLEMNPKHAETLYRLGLLEFDQKQDAKAKEYFQRFLEIASSGKRVLRIKRLMRRIE